MTSAMVRATAPCLGADRAGRAEARGAEPPALLADERLPEGARVPADADLPDEERVVDELREDEREDLRSPPEDPEERDEVGVRVAMTKL